MGQSGNTVWLAKDDNWVRFETVEGTLIATLHNSVGESATIDLASGRERVAMLLRHGWTVR